MSKQAQTVIFGKEQWSPERARAWLDKHDMRSDKMDETENSYRFRQFSPSECQADSYETLTQNLPAGVSIVVCERSGSAGLEDDLPEQAAVPMPSPEVLELLESRITVVQVKSPDGQRKLFLVRKGYDSEVEKDSAHEGRLRFVISSERVDRMGDVIMAGGWNLEHYRRNPIVLFGHEYGEVAGSPPSQGRTLDIGVHRRRGERVLEATVEFHLQTQFNRELFSMYRDRFMNTASVGFWPEASPEPIKAEDGNVTGLRFLKQDLLEWSLVAVPANPDAVQMALGKGIIRPRTAEYLSSLQPHADRTPRRAENTRSGADRARAMLIARGQIMVNKATTGG